MTLEKVGGGRESGLLVHWVRVHALKVCKPEFKSPAAIVKSWA